MRINLRSNFVLPGLEDKESLDLDRSGLTLREFLEELSRRAPIRIEYVRPGARALEDWRTPRAHPVEKNRIPHAGAPVYLWPLFRLSLSFLVYCELNFPKSARLRAFQNT